MSALELAPPEQGAVDAPYWAGLRQGRLLVQCCSGCGAWHWPAVWRCSTCGTWDPVWTEVPARGEIFSWTRTWHAFGGSPLKPPFVIAVVSLSFAGGRRLVGNLVGPETGLRIGAPVMGEFTSIDGTRQTVPVLRWRLAGTAQSPATEGGEA